MAFRRLFLEFPDGSGGIFFNGIFRRHFDLFAHPAAKGLPANWVTDTPRIVYLHSHLICSIGWSIRWFLFISSFSITHRWLFSGVPPLPPIAHCVISSLYVKHEEGLAGLLCVELSLQHAELGLIGAVWPLEHTVAHRWLCFLVKRSTACCTRCNNNTTEARGHIDLCWSSSVLRFALRSVMNWNNLSSICFS